MGKQKMQSGLIRGVYLPWSKKDMESVFRRFTAEYRKQMKEQEAGRP